MDFTLENAQAFPEGTAVAVYPASNWPTSAAPSGAPVGAPADTQTQEGGSLTFEGLTTGEVYWAVASVEGRYRYIKFIAGEDSGAQASILHAKDVGAAGEAGKVLAADDAFLAGRASKAEVSILNLETDWSAGDLVKNQSGQTNNKGVKADIRNGTAAAPYVGPGSTVKISTVSAITQAEHDSWPGFAKGGQTTDTGAFNVSIKGTAATQVQATAITAVAHNAGTTEAEGGSPPDALAGWFGAWQQDEGAIGRAIGLYAFGRNSLAGRALTGIEIQSQNETGEDHEAVSSGVPKSVGLLVSSGGSIYKQTGALIQMHHPTGWARADVGINIGSNDGGPIVNAVLRDNSSALRSIHIKGTHEKGALVVNPGAGGVFIGKEVPVEATTLFEVYTGEGALDPAYMFGTDKGAAIRGKLIRNSTGNLSAFACNGANNFMTGTAQGDAGLSFVAGKIFHVGASGKTSMLRVAEAGLGFFGTAPIAKPEVTGSRGGNAALASLLEKLAALGLVTNGSSA